ncbi:hypothetical protein [Bradyrhizobium sp. SZCCHNS3002]|uniref:hypothetical protein n=1 Tax=Bradyrhizobium sp. SZCCHNS3002 TaxID=3057310 RepID=UPI0028EC694F|nr:hypothetical protein [Bradyrhizobium sp. SZCCHNS3002]
MARPPLQLPPKVARDFMADLAAYRAAATSLEKEEIAARQLRALREYLRPSDGRLKLPDVRKLMDAMAEEIANKTPGDAGKRGRARR